MENFKANLLPILPVVVMPVILLSPVIFTGKALFWGTPATQFIPWWKFAVDTLLSGEMPLWNPLVGMGAPLIANYQSAIFYPPNWFYFVAYIVADLPGMAWSQALVLVAHLIWAGLGMAILLKRLGYGSLAQTISGLAFGMSGYLVARAWFSSINTAVAWLPWVLIGSLTLVANQRKITASLKLGFVIGLQLLAGHAQTSWYTLLLVALWVSFWTWRSTRDQGENTTEMVRSLINNWMYLAVAVSLGSAIAAVQLLPTAEYLLQSQRATAAEYDAAMTYSFWPWRFLGLLAPDIFGNPVSSDYWGYGNYWEDALYIGVLPLLLATGMIFKAGRRRRNWDQGENTNCEKPGIEGSGLAPFARNSQVALIRFLIGISIISVLLGLGKNTPIYPWLYRYIPTFSMFQAPTRWSIWFVTSLAFLAGLGAEYWRRPTGRGQYWTRLGTAGAFAVTFGAGIGGYFLKDVATDFKPTFVPALALAGLWGLGSGLLSLAAPEDGLDGRKVKLWHWGVIFWVCVDLGVASWGLNPGITLDFYGNQSTYSESIVDTVQQMVGEGRLYLLPDHEYNLKFKKFFRFDSFEPVLDWSDLRNTLLPNLNMLDGIPTANNYDPLVPGRYARWMERLSEMNIHNREDLLDLMGISLLEWLSPSTEIGVRFVPRHGAQRVRWVPCVRLAVDEEEAWELVFSNQVDFLAEVVIEGADQFSYHDCHAPLISPIITSMRPNKVVLKVDYRVEGWLVISDVWEQGWRARIDGEPVKVYKANYLFRGVYVPAGYHEITFVYQPIEFYIGVAISVLALIGLGGTWLYCKDF